MDLINSKFELDDYAVILRSHHGGTLVSIDPDGEEPHYDAIPLALIAGVDPSELVDIDPAGNVTSDTILTDGNILI